MEVWTVLQWAALILQAAVLVLAIWLYRFKRTYPFALLMLACICYVIMHSTWFTFNFVAGVFLASASTISTIRSWAYYTSQCFHVLFLIFLILALISFLREAVAQPSV